MPRVQQQIEVDAPIQACFDQWMRFEEFPRFMSHVKSVVRQGQSYHWVLEGPMGARVEWDAEMDGKRENRVISWHTVRDSEIKNQGAVTFEESNPKRTRITATMQYEPPAGPLGEAIARIFSNPDTLVQDDLQSFKNLVESKVASGMRR